MASQASTVRAPRVRTTRAGVLLPLWKPIEEHTRKLGYYVSVLASIVVDILGRFLWWECVS